MDHHHFISYSTIDGRDLAFKLYDALAADGIPVWLDKRKLHPGDDWDSQIAEAIRECETLLFLLTPDSILDICTCKQEWTRALKYKKSIVPLKAHRDSELPFRLEPRQWIDFTRPFDSALAQLRRHLQWLQSPEGVLHAMKDRLADAERDLRRLIEPADRERIADDLALLRKQIADQEQLIANPQAAAAKTEQSIAAAVEREREPAKPIAGITRTKFINPPPVVAPRYFQDRVVENRVVADFLKDDASRMMTIVGRAGIGKTAMVCRLLKSLESGQLPDDLGALSVDGIVYLSATGTRVINVPNLFADLCKLLPDDKARELDALYRNPQVTTEAKMHALLAAFPGGRVVVLLDNFESVLDVKTTDLADRELDDALRALLNAPHHAVKVVLTTRIAPHALGLLQPGRQARLTLDEGLESPFAENVLREMDADGKLGLKRAPDVLLGRARVYTRGFPRALEALVAILSADRYTTLEEILDQPLPPANVVEALVGEAFSRLDSTAERVMQGLAVYNRPVTAAAVDYVLQPFLPGADSAPVLNRLANMQFVRRESGRYHLHPVDREYAFGRVPVGSKADAINPITEATRNAVQSLGENPDAVAALERFFTANPEIAQELGRITPENAAQFMLEHPETAEKLQKLFTEDPEIINIFQQFAISATSSQDGQGQSKVLWGQYVLLGRAADYYAQTRKPRETWKTIDDLAPQLAEFDLRCAALDFDTAASVLRNIDFDYLLLWGHYRLMIDLHEKLQGKIVDPGLAEASVGNLGSAYYSIGNTRQAISCYERALAAARERKNRGDEGTWLGGLGNAYSVLGETRRAIEFHEQALAISREIGDRRGEGADLGNLGNRYAELGETRRAIEFHEQALAISREIGDRRGEGADLGNLGNRYAELGETRRAIEFYEQALAIAREINDRLVEGYDLVNLADTLIDIGQFSEAVQRATECLIIMQEITSPLIGSNSVLALSYLCSGNLPAARAAAESACKYDEPGNNHNAFALLGVIALRQGEPAAAQEAFTAAVKHADTMLERSEQNYMALDAKGLALCGMALLDAAGFNDRLGRAIESYRAARAINKDAGIVARVLRLVDALALADPKGAEKLAEARKAAGG